MLIPGRYTCIVTLLAWSAGCQPALAEDDAVRIPGFDLETASSFSPVPLNTGSLPPYDPEGTHIEYNLVLSGAMKTALYAHAPGFEIWGQKQYDTRRIRAYKFSLQSTPAAVLGEFTGDGQLDAYLSGQDKTYSIGVALLSNSATSYAVLERGRIKINEIGEWVYAGDTKKFRSVFAFLPKKSRYECGSDNITGFSTLKNDGIAIQDIYRDTEDKEYFWTQEIRYWDVSKKEFTGCATRPPDNIMFPEAYTDEHDSLAQSFALYNSTGPRIEYSVVLSSAMASALRFYNPDFMLWGQKNFTPMLVSTYKYSLQSVPSAVIGDFNGDGIIDAVLMGHDKTDELLIAILSKFGKEEYKVVGIWTKYGLWNSKNMQPESRAGGDLLLFLHHKGETIKSNNPNGCSERILKTDAFGVKNFDAKDIETLFPCGDMPVIVSCQL